MLKKQIKKNWKLKEKNNEVILFSDLENIEKKKIAIKVTKKEAFIFKNQENRLLKLEDFKNNKDYIPIKIATYHIHKIKFEEISYETLTSFTFVEIIKAFESLNQKHSNE